MWRFARVAYGAGDKVRDDFNLSSVIPRYKYVK